MKYFCILVFFICFGSLYVFSYDSPRQRLEATKNYQAAVKIISNAYEQKLAISSNQLLDRQKQIALNLAPITALYLAKINWNSQSDFAQKAYNAFLKIDIETALEVLNDQTLETALENAKKYASEKDTLLDNSLNNYILKAFLSTCNLNLEAAEKYYIKVLYEDQADFAKNYQLALLLIEQHKWERGNALCSRLLNMTNNDYEKVIALNLMGKLYDSQNRDQEASNYFSQAYTLWVDNKAKNSSDIYQSLLANSWISWGSILQEQRKSMQVENVLWEAFDIQIGQMETLPMAYYQKMIGTLKRIRDFYLFMPQTNSEKALLIQHKIDSTFNIYRELDTLRFPLDDYIASSMLGGKINRDFGAFRKALNIYQTMLKNAEQAKNNEIIILSLSQIADIHQLLGNTTLTNNYSIRVQTMLDSLINKEKMSYPTSLLVATNNLGAFYTTQGEYEKATNSYKNWEILFHKFFTDKQTLSKKVVVENLENKAQLFFENGELEQAQSILEKAHQIRKELYDQNKLSGMANLMNNYNRLIEIHLKKQNLYVVLNMLDSMRNLHPYEQGVLPLGLGIATTEYWINCGLAYIQLWKYVEANEAFEKANKLIDDNNYDYTILKTLGNRLIRGKAFMASTRGNYQEANSLYEAAKNQQSLLINKNPPAHIKDWIRIALERSDVLIKLGKPEEAQLQLFEVEEMIQIGNDDSTGRLIAEQVQFNMRLANSYREKFEVEKALSSYLKAIELCRTLQEKQPQIYKVLGGEVYIELARFHVKIDNYKEALSAYQIAIKIKERSLENQASAYRGNLITAYWEMAQLHQTFTHFEEAIQTYQKLIGILEILVKSDSTYNSNLADIYSFMAWCSVLIREYSHADAYIQAALVWDSDSKWLKVKMPMVYLLNDDFEEAQKIYTKNLDDLMDGVSLRQIYMADLNILEAHQIMHPDIQKIKDLLLKERK